MEFAILPVRCSDNISVWWGHYYQFYKYYFHDHQDEGGRAEHPEFRENITEAEYIVRKLTENF